MIGSFCLSLQAQQDPNCRWIPTNSEQLLDSLSVLPFSIQFPNNSDSVQFSWNQDRNTIHVRADFDSVLVCYRTLNLALHQPWQRYSMDVYDSNAHFKPQPLLKNDEPNWRGEELFPTENIQKTGTLTRGISFGNRQNMFVNSALNLQMEGMLSDKLAMRAQISDQNIPYQPDGNTGNLQDFDRVLVELESEKLLLQAGDVVLESQERNFLKYRRNIQGASAVLKDSVGGWASTSALSLSQAKGKFASIVIEVKEGDLGPYRLLPNKESTFAVIMANSEKVFIDGALLERGFDKDYVIDYNLAELIFMPRTLITRFSRVRVDFEYADQNYVRSIRTAQQVMQKEGLEFFVANYRERDNPDKPLMVGLSDQDRFVLSQLGNRPENWQVPSVDSVAFSSSEILYAKVDTLVNGQPFSIYQYSSDPNSAFYRLSFARKGLGQGNYLLQTVQGVGRIYYWVAPLNGVPQGEYEPLRQLNAPEEKQMTVAGASVRLGKNIKAFTEAAFASMDNNLFSENSDNQNLKMAVKAGLAMEDQVLGSESDWQLSWQADVELLQRDFQAIDRFRAIEFDRDWNLEDLQGQSLIAPAADHIYHAGLQLRKNTNTSITYDVNLRQRDTLMNGVQHKASFSQKWKHWMVQSDGFWMENALWDRQASWKRLNAEITRQNTFFSPGYRYQTDRNVISDIHSDSISGSAMHFDQHTVFVRSSDTLSTRYQLSYSWREDRLPWQGEIASVFQSQTLQAEIGSSFAKTQELTLVFTWREISPLTSIAGLAEEKEKNLLGRIDWRGSFFKKHVQTDFSLSPYNGREIRREFVYVPVPTGQGTHTWRDDNGNGIKELEEFYEAINFDERNYIRVFVPTSEFIQAYGNQLNWRTRWDMPKNWRNGKGWKSWVGKISGQSFWTSDQKVSSEDLWSRFMPFAVEIPDSELISQRELLQHTLFFNRSNPRWGGDMVLAKQARKQLLTTGFDGHEVNRFQRNVRAFISKEWEVQGQWQTESTRHASEVIRNRNYEMLAQQYRAVLNWQPGNHFRLSTHYQFQQRIGMELEVENQEANIQEFGVLGRYSHLKKGMLQADVRYMNISFEGQENSALGYELLQALRPGGNLISSIQIQKKLSNGLQLNLGYEGRKTPDLPLIHTGRMSLTAFF